MSQTPEQRQKAQFEAMAVLVAGGVIGRKEGIDALTYSIDQTQADRATRDQYPPGYGTARSMARLVLMNRIDYSEAEQVVALALTGGEYPDDFATAESQGSRLLGQAVSGFERLRVRVADRLQFVLAEQGLAGRNAERGATPQITADARQPLELRQEAVEPPKPVPGHMAPRTVMRRPARQP